MAAGGFREHDEIGHSLDRKKGVRFCDSETKQVFVLEKDAMQYTYTNRESSQPEKIKCL